MPWRLITFVIILGLVVIFAGFNTTDTSNISFGVYVAEDVPIFISLFFAFAVGMVMMVPFLIGSTRKKRVRRGKVDPVVPENPETNDVFTPDVE